MDDEFAGGIGVTLHTGEILGVAEFGYWLAPKFWGRGIATEAATLLAEYALTSRGLRRLEAHVFEPNVASMRVLEKSGFHHEATLAQRYIDRDGTIINALLFAGLARIETPGV